MWREEGDGDRRWGFVSIREEGDVRTGIQKLVHMDRWTVLDLEKYEGNGIMRR